VLTEYRGLTVKALKDLRRALGENATYAVSKNTLTTIAAREAGVPGIEEHLVGPTAIAFIDGDPVIVAKGLRDFARLNPLLVIKGGVLDGKFLSPDEVRKLADLESREVLLAKVAGGMKGVLQQAVSLVSAPLSQAARLFAALQDAADQNPSLIGGPGSPAETTEPSNAPAEADSEETPEPTNADLEASPEETPEPTNTEPTNTEPTNEELAAPAATAAPAAPPEAASAAEDN
jgi:large subunit ribosomal protein L10